MCESTALVLAAHACVPKSPATSSTTSSTGQSITFAKGSTASSCMFFSSLHSSSSFTDPFLQIYLVAPVWVQAPTQFVSTITSPWLHGIGSSRVLQQRIVPVTLEGARSQSSAVERAL